MAQIDVNTFEAQKAAKQSGYNGEGPKVTFLNTLLKLNAGETSKAVVVRFPYKTVEDIKIETCHEVTFPGDKYPRRVSCKGTDCALCAEGIKVVNKFFLKAIAYVIDNATGKVVLTPVVWERNGNYATELKEKLLNMGDLTNYLFTIKVTKTGTERKDVKYSTEPLLNKVAYPDNIYTNDLSSIEKVDPVKICARTVEKYLIATGKMEAPVKESPAAQPAVNAAPTNVTVTPVEEAPERPKRVYTPGL